MPQPKLAEDRKQAVIKLLELGLHRDDIARQTEVSAGSVSFIKREWEKAGGKVTRPKLKPAELDATSEIAHFKAKSHTLQATLNGLLKERGKQKALVDDLKTVIRSTEPYPRRPIKIATGHSDTPIAAVVKLSDWQIGEVIDPVETEGFGGFDHEIAKQRAAALARKVIRWVKMHRNAGYNIRELHVFSEADLVSGNIHYELEVTNEFTVIQAAVNAGFLLAETISQFAPYFDKIMVWEMSADNHGRQTRKNQAKQGAKNNFSYMAHVICNLILAKHEHVTCELGQGTKLLANVLGKRFLISHGHHIMGQMGIPYYGMERDRAREAVKRQHTNKGFDYISIGHWHVPAIIAGNILVNGSLTGTTEFDHMQGRHAVPAQVSFMVHPEHGIFNWTAWKLNE